MQFWNLLHAACWKHRTQKSRQKSPYGHHRTNLSGCIFTTKARIDNRKKLLSSNTSSRCPHNMVNFGLLAAEIGLTVWGTPANFNWFRILASLLHGSQVVSVSQTLWRWTEGATYVRQGDHHVGHWPTFLVFLLFWRTKLANVLETSGRLPFHFSAFLFCCSDTTTFCFMIRLFVRTARSNGHSYNCLRYFSQIPLDPWYRGYNK